MAVIPKIQGINNPSNLREWKDLILSPFKNYPNANYILDDQPESLIRLKFPITIAGLYGFEKDSTALACLSLNSKRAEMVTLEIYKVFDSKYGPTSRIEGSWQEVVAEYIKFMHNLSAVPMQK